MKSETKNYFLVWDCMDCGHENIPCSPRHRYCPNCDHPRTFAEFDKAGFLGDNVTFDPSSHEEVSDDDSYRLEDAGASWFCVTCYADNYGDERDCHHCGTLRGATDSELRNDTSYDGFVAFMDGDQGASADLVESFGEYAGMRAAHGESFNMDDSLENQLERAQEGRSAFKDELEEPHEARPDWEASDLPSSVESMEKTHGSKRPEAESPKPPFIQIERFNPDKVKRNALIGALALAGLLVVSFLIWGFQTRPVEGTVHEMQWERVIQEQKWTPVKDEDWRDNLQERSEIRPTNGSGERAGVKITSCRNKHHHYEQYQCGTKEVSCTHMETYYVDVSCTKYRTESYSCQKTRQVSCGTYECGCSTSRNANGTGSRTCNTCTKYCSESYSDSCSRQVSYQDTCSESRQRAIHSSDTVPKYCDRSIEKSYCGYRTQRWKNSDRYHTEGKSRPAKWPKGSKGPLERELRSDSYTIVFSYQSADRTTSKTVSKSVPLNKFQEFKRGDTVTFMINNFGSVRSFEARGLTEEF